ncbi:MAG TPA: hypothetical protein VF585_02330, partial [Chthoniobacterales bacterium]
LPCNLQRLDGFPGLPLCSVQPLVEDPNNPAHRAVARRGLPCASLQRAAPHPATPNGSLHDISPSFFHGKRPIAGGLLVTKPDDGGESSVLIARDITYGQ